MLFASSLSAQSVGPLQNYVDIVGSIALEESDSVVTVTPIVKADSEGFLIADAREAQVRLYGKNGRLKKLLARRGSGPGEVGVPMAILRRGDRTILVMDMGSASMIRLSPEGEEIDRYPMRFPAFGLLSLGEDVLVVGKPSFQDFPFPDLLHRWDGKDVVEGFFPAPITERTEKLSRSYSFASADIRGDTIVASYALSDTLYFYHTGGEFIDQTPLDLEHWSLPEEDPSGGVGSGERRKWRESLTRISDVYWLEDGTFLVQYVGHRDRELQWRLSHVTRDGEVLFDVKDTPRLLTVDGDLLYFVDAHSLTEDRWVVASLH